MLAPPPSTTQVSVPGPERAAPLESRQPLRLTLCGARSLAARAASMCELGETAILEIAVDQAPEGRGVADREAVRADRHQNPEGLVERKGIRIEDGVPSDRVRSMPESCRAPKRARTRTSRRAAHRLRGLAWPPPPSTERARRVRVDGRPHAVGREDVLLGGGARGVLELVAYPAFKPGPCRAPRARA